MWKYVWVKKCIEMCEMLFKNWKWLFEITNQTPPKLCIVHTLGGFENVKYIIYFLLLLFFVNKNVKYTIRLVSFLSKLFSCSLKFIWAQISNWFRKNPNKKKKKKIWPISIQTQITKQLFNKFLNQPFRKKKRKKKQ